MLKKYTDKDWEILKQEVAKFPQNITVACCRASAKIFNMPELANLSYEDSHTNKYTRAIIKQWYRIAKSSQTVFLLVSQSATTSSNLKIFKRG